MNLRDLVHWRRPQQLLVAVLVGALVLSACSPAADPTPTTTTNGLAEHGPIRLAVGGDSGGLWAKAIKTWNAAHPSEPVTIAELSSNAETAHLTLADAGRASSGEFTVMALDPIWVPEFAENEWVVPLSSGLFPTAGMLASSVSGGSYQGKLYGYPVAADVGVLYFRKDLLAAAKLKAPKTWAELTAACGRILTQQRGMHCYGADLGESEELTVNVAESISSAGGELASADGTPGLDSASAIKGVSWLADGATSGIVAADALEWGSGQTAAAFTDGELVFARGWASQLNQLRAGYGAAKKVGVVQIPGLTGTGVPTTGGYQLAISAKGRNQGTAADLIRWLSTEQLQRQLWDEGSVAPVVESLYSDRALIKQHPELTTLAASLKVAKSRPGTPKYDELSTAVQTTIHPVLAGDSELGKALTELQLRLSELLK